ncbi:CBS domain-containing protein [Candidatus Woesebacteria bacterium]|nr:CBS domain-containing protein [Candidatus Woesebacteria bacterium]
MLISEIYHKKVKTISDNYSIRDALKELIEDKINGLVVVDKNKQVVGVLSLQDIAAATLPRQFRQNINMAAAMYKKGFFHEMCTEIMDDPVKKFMRKSFVSVDLDDNIMAVIADFLRNDLYIVPVINKKKLVGIVTRSEIKKALAYGMNIHL